MSAQRRMSDVLVIGGGVAGLAAAITAADAGAQVTLIERRPRLGGAATSFRHGGLWVDNGVHVFLGCCTAYRGFLARLGVSALAPVRRLSVPVIGTDGRLARLHRARLPAPAHLLPLLASYRVLGLADRLRLLPAVRALGRVDPADPDIDSQPAGSWLAAHHQSPAAVAGLWDLLIRATLNATPDEAALSLCAMVVQTGLLAAPAAADLGVANVPLGRLHDIAARDVLIRRGVRIERTAARSLRDTPGGWAVATDTGEFRSRGVVLSVPPLAADQLLPTGATRIDVSGLGSSPIINVHLRYDREVLPWPLAAAVGSPLQWVFDRTAAAGERGGQYVVASVSAADTRIGAPAATIAAEFAEEMARLFPAARSARLREAFVTREPTATFRQTPGQAAKRRPPTTGLPGLGLAGSWTATGWPATMEGGVRSGIAAALAVLATWRDRSPAVLDRPPDTPAGTRRPPGTHADTRTASTAPTTAAAAHDTMPRTPEPRTPGDAPRPAAGTAGGPEPGGAPGAPAATAGVATPTRAGGDPGPETKGPNTKEAA